MNREFRNKLFRWLIAMSAMWLFFACHSGKSNQSVLIEKLMNTTQRNLTDTYGDYLQRINYSAFISEEPGTDSMGTMESDFKSGLSLKADLYYFPSTLWQMYSLSGERKWEQAAKNFSQLITESKMIDHSKDPSAYHTFLYCTHLHSRNPESSALLLESLSGIISESENVFQLDSLSPLSKAAQLEKLRINELLFFASKETGDPVYRNLALQNSELIYNHLSGSSSFATIDNSDLQLIGSRSQAIGLSVFFYLFKETGMEKYQRLSIRLAEQFIQINQLAENKKTVEPGYSIHDEMDLVTQAMVALTLFELGDHQGKSFRDISSQVFQHILLSLATEGNDADTAPSFELFYYLFKYEKQLQALDKKDIMVINSLNNKRKL